MSGLEAQLCVYEIMGSIGDGEGRASRTGAVGRDPRVVAGERDAEVPFLWSEVQWLQRVVADNGEQAVRQDVILRHAFTKMNRNIAWLAHAPGRRIAVEPTAVSDAIAT